jgi:inhibitor of the pro-sigma K processing machinery
MVTLVLILMALVALGLGSLVLKLLKKPIKWALKLLLHAAAGFVGLVIFDLLGSYVGLSLGLNWLNSLIAGVLGIPGVVLMLLVKYIIF